MTSSVTGTDSPRYLSRYLDNYSGVTARSLIRTPPLSDSQSLLDQEGNLRSAKKSFKFESDARWVLSHDALLACCPLGEAVLSKLQFMIIASWLIAMGRTDTF